MYSLFRPPTRPHASSAGVFLASNYDFADAAVLSDWAECIAEEDVPCLRLNLRQFQEVPTVQYSTHFIALSSPPARPLYALASAAYPAHRITALIAKGRARVVPKSDSFLK